MQENLLRFDKDSLFVFLDFETLNLNLNFCVNLPWQLGMMKVKGNDILDTKDILIKWNTPLKISVGAAKATHYSQEKVDNLGRKPEEVFPIMYDWLESADKIIGHNVLGFDIYLIYQWYQLQGKNPRNLVDKFIDTNALAKAYKLQQIYNPKDDFLCFQYSMLNKKQKGLKTRLETMGRELGISHDYENLHDALCDLQLNKKVWDRLKFMMDI